MTQDSARQAREELARSMKLLITQVAKALVDSPESVHVEADLEQDATVLVLQVAPSDLGKIIGKQGRTARSIRTILGAASIALRSISARKDHPS